MVNAADILNILNTIAPFELAEDWDNCGLQVGNVHWEVRKIMIGLDVSLPLMAAAKDWNADLVITHHPLMIMPEKKIDFAKIPGQIIEIAAKYQINVVSVHTNLDKAHDGLNDYFASKIEMVDVLPFLADKPLNLTVLPIAGTSRTGTGRIGQFESQISLGDLAYKIKKNLKLNYLRVTGDSEFLISTAVICTGSGASLLDDFFASDAQVFITGDMKYHDARRVEEHSRGLIDVGHFESEQIAIDLLYEKLTSAFQSAGVKIQIRKFKEEKDPFTIV